MNIAGGSVGTVEYGRYSGTSIAFSGGIVFSVSPVLGVRMSSKGFDPYHRWLGIPASEQPPNHYRLLGIVLFESDSEVIDSAAMRQMAHVRSHSLGPLAELSQSILNELAEARRTLLDPALKQIYDDSLRRSLDAPRPANGNESLLQKSLACPVCSSKVSIEPQFFGEVVQCGACQSIWRVSRDGLQCEEVLRIADAFVNGGAVNDLTTLQASLHRTEPQVQPAPTLRVSTRKQQKKKTSVNVLQIVAVPLGGFMGLGIAILILWFGFGVDPFGVFVGETVSQTNETLPVAAQQSSAPKANANKSGIRAGESIDSRTTPDIPVEAENPPPVELAPEVGQDIEPVQGPTEEERQALALVLKASAERVNPRVLEWKDVTGEFGTLASLVSQTDSEVVLEDADGKSVVVEKVKVDSRLINPVNLAWLRQQDSLQYSELRPLLSGHVPQSEGGAEAAFEAYISLHRKYKTSPYAGLVAAVGLSMDKNDVKAATIILRDVIERLRSHRELDPSSHRLTYSTALNNLAVCLMKEGKGSAAAAMLQEAGEVLAPDLLPPVLYENIRLVQKLDPSNPIVRLTARHISDLTDAIANQIPEGATSKSAAYLKYSLIWDLPWRGVVSEDSFSSLTPTQMAKDGVVVSSGFGFLVADGWVVTNSNLLRDGFWAPEHAVIRAYPLPKGPASASTITELKFGSEETDALLALIKVPEGSGKPLPLNVLDMGREDSFLMAQRGAEGNSNENFSLVSTEVTHEAAVVTELGLPNLLAFETRDVIATELNGTPVIDDYGNAIGIAVSEPFRPYGLFRGLVTPAAAIKGLLFNHPGPMGMPPNVTVQGAGDANTLQTLVTDSLFKIDVWVGIENVPGAYGVFNKTDLNTEYADHWCIRCSGGGAVKCPNRACNLGRIFNKVKEVVEIEPQTKTPIYGDRVFYTPCEVCKGKGKIDCNLCKDGRY